MHHGRIDYPGTVSRRTPVGPVWTESLSTEGRWHSYRRDGPDRLTLSLLVDGTGDGKDESTGGGGGGQTSCHQVLFIGWGSRPVFLPSPTDQIQKLEVGDVGIDSWRQILRLRFSWGKTTDRYSSGGWESLNPLDKDNYFDTPRGYPLWS